MTTSSGSKAWTNSRASASAPLTTSRRPRDGPGRFRSGLWDIQHRLSDISTSSLGQMEHPEQRRAQFGSVLRYARTGDAAVGAQEQHRIRIRVEPRLEGAGAVADDDDVGVVVSRPPQLRHGTGGNEFG